MGWWELGEVAAFECLLVGCLWVFALVSGFVVVVVQVGGVVGGDVVLIDIEGFDVVFQVKIYGRR